MSDFKLKPVDEFFSFNDLLKANRPNKKIPGFDFDVDTFENLLDNFVPYDMVAKILRVSISDLDKFCHIVYNMKYSEAYNVLTGIADMFLRRSVKNLAHSGNGTALNIAKEHFMKLDSEKNDKPQKIVIVNDLKEVD